MRDHLVICGNGSARVNPGALEVAINLSRHSRSEKNINVRIDDISSRLADNLPPLLTDLLEIASYVFCADQFTNRGSVQMRDMGADWRRQFRFVIPVRNPTFWRSNDVVET